MNNLKIICAQKKKELVRTTEGGFAINITDFFFINQSVFNNTKKKKWVRDFQGNYDDVLQFTDKKTLEKSRPY